MSFWKVVKLLGKPAGRLATELIPDLVESIRVRRAAGESDQVIVNDIRSRLSEVSANRAARDEEFEKKFGFRPDEGATD